MVDRHKLTVFYLKSFDMDSVQVGKAVFGKEIHTSLGKTSFLALLGKNFPEKLSGLPVKGGGYPQFR